jgi:hypothetical protein
VLPPEEEAISAAERTNAAFILFQNKCQICGQVADEIVPNYVFRDVIHILKESASKEADTVQDVRKKIQKRIEDPITLEQMKDPVIQVPCGHSICAKVWESPDFGEYQAQCQECKQECKTVAENAALKASLKVLNKHFLLEAGISSKELAKLIQEDLWGVEEVALENPEHLFTLRDAAISLDVLSKLAPSIQTTILRKPDHFISLLKNANLSIEVFSSLSIFDQATALAADLDYGVRWLKFAQVTNAHSML